MDDPMRSAANVVVFGIMEKWAASFTKLDAGALSWGVEKALSSSTQRVGVATQKFTIDVTP